VTGLQTPVDADVVRTVTGVSTAELLERLAAARGGRPTSLPTSSAWARRTGPDVVRTGTWSLADFGDGTDEAFVAAAHQVLLRRPVTAAERERRVRDLGNGVSRLEVLLRLALCPEGRRAHGQPLRGVVLPSVVGLGRAVERRVGDERLGRVATAGRPVATLLAGHSPRAAAARRSAVRVGLVAAAAVALRRDRRLRGRLAVLETAGGSSR
jgi:hypothetical protein